MTGILWAGSLRKMIDDQQRLILHMEWIQPKWVWSSVDDIWRIDQLANGQKGYGQVFTTIAIEQASDSMSLRRVM